jgi:hypothetical protein
MDVLSDPFVVIPFFLVVNVTIAVVFATVIIVAGEFKKYMFKLQIPRKSESEI